jgi:hypothetical protein
MPVPTTAGDRLQLQRIEAMILSHKYRCIFLKTRKTAGTSVEISLSRYCSEHDVITPICDEDEVLRRERGCGPQNYQYRLRDYSLRDLARLLLKGRPKPGLRFYNHMSACEVRRLVGRRCWDSYFKFCFERNPWDKVLSQFHFDNQGWTEFDDFLRHGTLWSDFDCYTIDGELAVDHVGRYERLGEELNAICARLGIPFDGWLPRAKGQYRRDRRPCAEVYRPDQAALVAERFAREIERFSYQLGEERLCTWIRFGSAFCPSRARSAAE